METFTLDIAIGLNMTHAFFYAESVNAAVWNRARLAEAKLRGCLHDTGAPAWVHSRSLSWLYICLHDTQCHAGASHSGVSSPRLLYQGENFTPVRNFVTVSCKHETTTHFARVFYQHEVYLQITEIWNDPSSCKRDTKPKSHPDMKLAPVRVLSCIQYTPPPTPFVVSAGINALMKSTRLQNFQRHHGKRVRFTSEASIDWDRKGAIYTAKNTNFAFWMQLEKHPLWQTCEDKHWQSNCQDIQWDRHFHSVRYR